MKATVSERGRLTIPKALRDRLGIRGGEVLEMRAEAGRLVISKTLVEDRAGAASVLGILDLRQPTDQLVEELRGRSDRN